MSQSPTPVPLEYSGPDTAPRKFNRAIIGWVLFIALAFVLFVIVQERGTRKGAVIPLSEFRDQLLSRNVSWVIVTENSVRGAVIRPVKTNSTTLSGSFYTQLPTGIGANWGFLQWVMENHGTAVVSTESEGNLIEAVVIPLIPWLLVFGFIWFFVFRLLRAKAFSQAAPTRVIVVNPEVLK